MPIDYTKLAERNRRIATRRHQLTHRAIWRFRLLRLLVALPPPRVETAIPGRLLLIRPDHLGDVLLTTPAIRALAQAQPQAHLFALTGEWSAVLLGDYKEIERVVTVPFPGFVREARRLQPWQPYTLLLQSAAMVRTLRAEVAVILRPDHWWGALLAYWAGIPVRIGYNLPGVKPFLTNAIPFTATHAVRQSLRLVEQWTGAIPDSDVDYHFPRGESDRAALETVLTQLNVPPSDCAPRVAIHPGAGTAIKRWPAGHWAAVADTLAEQWGATIVFTGGAAEGMDITRIAAAMSHKSISLAGKTTLGTLAALYRTARVVIGVDSGPLHLAVACGAPTVHLYGPADPVEFGPWGDPNRHIVLTSPIGCRPCRILDWPDVDAINHPCVRDISPQIVIDAALRAAQSPT
ncbi:MAG: glycosyltransferase family 9 protein [Aggregatilineales bacterium]